MRCYTTILKQYLSDLDLFFTREGIGYDYWGRYHIETSPWFLYDNGLNVFDYLLFTIWFRYVK